MHSQILIYQPICLVGDWSLIPDWVIPNAQKMVLDATKLNMQHKVQSKGKWSNPGKGVTPTPTLRCNNYWKRKFWICYVEECATGVHVTKNGYMNGSVWHEMSKETCVCKIDVKCNIAIFYCLAFHSQYLVLYNSEEIISISQNYLPHGRLQNWQRRINSEHYKSGNN